MQTSTKLVVSALLVAATVCGAGFILSLSSYSVPVQPDGVADSNAIRFSNLICQSVKRADGSVEDFGCTHNAILTQGRNFVMQHLALNSSNSGMIYIGFGNTTGVAAADTALANEIADCGLTRNVGTVYILNTSAYTVQLTVTNTCASTTGIKVNTTGIYNSSVGSMLVFAGNLTNPPTLSQNDQLTQNYTVNLA